jgi:hypothetical protein
MTPNDFAHALLHRLGLPESGNNVAALVAFQAIEGGHMHNSAAYNPLNTTWKMSSSQTGKGLSKSIGVQAYASWDEGIEATAKTLTNGLYKDILAALARSAPPDETLKIIAKSPWGGFGGYKVPIGQASVYQSYRALQFPGAAGTGGSISGTVRDVLTSKPGQYGMALYVGMTALGALGLVAFALAKQKSGRGRRARA